MYIYKGAWHHGRDRTVARFFIYLYHWLSPIKLVSLFPTSDEIYSIQFYRVDSVYHLSAVHLWLSLCIAVFYYSIAENNTDILYLELKPKSINLCMKLEMYWQQ
jgi:hypothetical protein